MRTTLLIGSALTAAACAGDVCAQSNGAESRDPQISASGAAQAFVPATGATVLVLFDDKGGPPLGTVVDSLYALVQRAISGWDARATVFGPTGSTRYRSRDDTRAWFAQYGITRGILIPLVRVDSVASAIGRLRAAGVRSALAVAFTVNDADPAIPEAIRRATEIARQHADALAGAAGGTLGRLLRLSIQPINAGDLRRYDADINREVYTPPAHIGVRVTVHGTWTLQPI